MRQESLNAGPIAVAEERGQTNEELQAALAAAELARERAEASEARFRQSEEREHFLAEASRVLGSSIDFGTTIQKVAMLAVPRLADWCGVDLLDDNGDLQQIAVAHIDPAKVEWARQLRKQFPPDPADAPTGVRAVIRTGKSEFYPDITDEMIEASARDEAHLALLRELDLHGVIIAPLTAGDRTLGALSLISSRGSRHYNEADVSLAEELAHRAALAIQSSRLYTAEQEARLHAEDAAERSKRLQAVTAGLSQAATPVAVADAALGDSIAALGASTGALFAVDFEGKSLEIIKAVGLDDRALKDFRTIPLDAPLPLSDAIRERTAVYIESREELLERYPLLRDVNRSAATTAWAIAPLTVGDRIVGGMSWGFGNQRTFDDADRAFIDSVARQCALAVERAQLYAAERSARESAQAANRAKSDFLATMSHELRTPINAIQGYAQLLDLGIPGPVTGQQREYLNRVTSSAQHLLGLVNEVLDLAKIESGTITVENEAIIAADTVDAALSLIRPQAASKELSLSEECEGARETPYLGDEHRVRQILTNLLSNAVKFTAPGGRITVGCTVTEDAPATVKDGRDGPFVVFRIADTGTGIEPDQIERIFDPFTQAETVHRNPYTRGAGGTGLGLTISRRLARLMGGELTVKSTPGAGSEFSLWMPMSERRIVERASEVVDPANLVAGEGAATDTTSGLARIAEGLLRETGSLVNEYVRRVRAHPDIPMAANDSDAQIEDHTATFLADVAIGLRLLEIAGGDPSDMLRDSSAIMRAIMEQHGGQRFRLGWNEDAIASEMTILRDVTCEAVRRIAGDASEETEQACAAVAQFVAQATRHTIGSYRFAAATLQLGATRA